MDFSDADPDPDAEADGGTATVTTGEFDPTQMDIEEVEAINRAYLKANERGPGGPARPQRDGIAKAFDPVAKGSDMDGTTYKSEFPWLSDPVKGVRWDFDPVQLRTLAQENAWVQMLIQSITKEISEMSWTITEAEDEAETAKRLNTHPDDRKPVQKDLPDTDAAREIHDTLRRPNPDITYHDMVEMTMSDLLEVGSAAIVKAFPEWAYDADDALAVEPDRVTPNALKPTAPEVWTKEYHAKAGILEGFWQFEVRQNPGGRRPDSRGYQDPIFFDKSEVLWQDMSPRTNRRYGIPPTLLVQDWIKAVDLALVQEQEYLSRGSTPSGMVTFPDGIDRPAGQERSNVMTEDVKGKPWKLLEIEGTNAEYTPFSYNFKEMEFTARQQWYARVISSAFQVPTAVVGLEPEKINYATFQGERANFESNTLGPYVQMLERWINWQLVQPHWSGYRFEILPGMSESTREKKSNRVRSEFNDNLRERNEARREIGLDEVPDEEDGFKDEVVEDSGDDAADLLAEAASKGDSGNVNKADDEPLRNTEEFAQFAVQPGDVEALQEAIADDVAALYDTVLESDDIMGEIDRLAADPEETEKSLGRLTAKLREILTNSDIAGRIASALDEHTTEAAQDALRQAASEVGEDADVDVEAIEAKLDDREVKFADRFAQEMAGDIRETVSEGWAEGKNSDEIASEIAEGKEINSGWDGAEKIARQELQVATGEARQDFAAEVGKVERWVVSGADGTKNPDEGDGRVRPAHQEMNGLWKWPSDSWKVDYTEEGRGVHTESVPGNSEPGIGCRCFAELVDRSEVDAENYAGTGTP
jgi:phage portal protein BeeE